MKINRRKRAKRILTFYKSRFNFREPYQILVDGTFCQAALQSKVNIRDQIPPYLDGEVKLLTTLCAIHETETLGPVFCGAMMIVKQFPVHKCGHEKNYVSASKCFELMVGESNSNHYIVATQDQSLKQRLRNVAGTPIMYLHYNAPVLESPSELCSEAADVRNLERAHATDYQKSVLEKMKSDAGIVTEEMTKRKRRRKGPNPLSCKKKKPVAKVLETNAKSRKRFRVKIAKHVKEMSSNKN